jgi:nucleotide-binding universal stress UspA family protein
MTASLTSRATTNGVVAHAREPFRSLLVAVDLTPISDRVLARVAHLRLADGARLTLLHVVPESLPIPHRRRAIRDARKTLAGEARNLGKSLPRHVSIESVVKLGAAAKQIATCATAAKAELIVMGRGGGRALRDTFLGSTAERVIRRGQLPVLVVRLGARSPYGRPAIALDLDQTAHDVIAVMLRVLPPSRARVAVIHAFDMPYRGWSAYPSLSKEDTEEEYDELAEQGSRGLAKLLATSIAKVRPEDVPMWKAHVRYGSPRLVIEKAVKKLDTDLLVLGTHRFTGVAYMFLGTVAGDVLREVACDVLVVPPRPPRA